MTISSAQNRASYAGNGSTTMFAVPFRFLSDGDLVVILVDDATGVPTTQVLTTDYTVSGAGNPMGGTVTFVTAPATGKSIRIWGDPALTQLVDYSAGGPLPAESHEQALDRATLQQKRTREIAERSLHVPDADDEGVSTELPNAVARADMVLGFDASGEPKLYSATDPAFTTFTPNRGIVSGASGELEASASTKSEVALLSGATLPLNAHAAQHKDGGSDEIATTTPAAGAIPKGDVDGTLNAWVSSGAARNFIINGQFEVAQRGSAFTSTTTPANNDDTYLLDRWLLLSDGNDRVDVSRESSVVPTGARTAIKLDVETVGSPSERFGIFQPIELRDCIGLRGQKVSLAFEARTTSGAVRNVRAAIVEWSGTADSITSDIVSAWNAEGANPTLATNWAFRNTPSDLALTNSYQKFSINGETLGSTFNNLGVFIWVDDDDLVAGDLVYISNVQLVKSASAGDFPSRAVHEEIELCERFYEKSYAIDTDPGTATVTGCFCLTTNSYTSDAYFLQHPIQFRKRKRATPTVVAYAASTGTSGKIQFASGEVVASVVNVSDSYFGANGTNAAATAARIFFLHWTADAEL